jgi:hypothetical protein
MRSVNQDQTTCSSPKTLSLAADLAGLGRLLQSLFDPYRPELYYMRGPGPKWRAKHSLPAPNMARQGVLGPQLNASRALTGMIAEFGQ